MSRSSSAVKLAAVQNWYAPGRQGDGISTLLRTTWTVFSSIHTDGTVRADKNTATYFTRLGFGGGKNVTGEGLRGKSLCRGEKKGSWHQRIPFGSFASYPALGNRSFRKKHGSVSYGSTAAGNITSDGRKQKDAVLKNTSGDAKDSEENAALLQSVRAIDFLPHVEALKMSKKVITYDELIKEFHLALPLASDEDAHAICESLAKSGSIIKMGDVVYLHPQEIAQTLRTVLPIDAPMLRKRLAVVKALLEPMERTKARIELSGMRRNKMISYSFLGLLAAQWGLFFRLCYWEFSWDVVEPIGFFANGLTTILSFAWFMQTRKDFSFEGMSHRVTSLYVKRKFEGENFDFVEYTRLQQERQRLEESLSSIRE